MDDVQKTMDYLMEAEVLACDVLSLKQNILELHKRANECREAVSELNRSEVKSAYMYEGALMVKNTKEEVISRLTNDHRELQGDIKRKGAEMKEKVFRLQDLELQTPYRGRSLIPLDTDELKALTQVWGG